MALLSLESSWEVLLLLLFVVGIIIAAVRVVWRRRQMMKLVLYYGASSWWDIATTILLWIVGEILQFVCNLFNALKYLLLKATMKCYVSFEHSHLEKVTSRS